MPHFIIAFCGNCGVQLPMGLGTKPKEEQICENCNEPVGEREQRAEGLFSEEDTAKLLAAIGE
jgi:hypothetical protein